MVRARQVAGGVVLAALTLVVVAGAAYALWLGAPLLDPDVYHFTARDIPIISTDAKIVLPIPSADSSSRSGIVRPAPAAGAPKARAVSRKSAAKRRPTSTVARDSSPSIRTRPRVVAEADAHDRGNDNSEHSGTESD